MVENVKQVIYEDLLEVNPEDLKELFQTIINGKEIYNYHDNRDLLVKMKELLVENNMMFEAAQMVKEIAVSHYKKGETKQTILLIETAVDMLKNTKKNSKRDELIFKYLLDIAIANYELLNYAKSWVTFEKCTKMLNEKFPHDLLFKYYYDFGILCIYIEQYDKCLKLLDNAIHYTENNDVKKGRVYNNLGRCYWRMKDYEKSLEMYSKALELFETDKYRIAMIYNNMSLVYNALNEHDKAMELIGKCFELFDRNDRRKHLIYYDTYVRIAIDSEDLGEIINKLLNVVEASNGFSVDKRHIIDPIELIAKRLRKTKDIELGTKLKNIIISLIEEVGEVEYRDSYDNRLYACLGELSYLLGVQNKI